MEKRRKGTGKNPVGEIENFFVKKKFKEAFDLCLSQLAQICEKEESGEVQSKETESSPFLVPKMKHICSPNSNKTFALALIFFWCSSQSQKKNRSKSSFFQQLFL